MSIVLGLGFASAQQAIPAKTTPTKTVKTVEKKGTQPAQKLKKDGTPDRRYKVNKKLKKDGTPDKRYKENR